MLYSILMTKFFEVFEGVHEVVRKYAEGVLYFRVLLYLYDQVFEIFLGGT